jgi:hypothetical protein
LHSGAPEAERNVLVIEMLTGTVIENDRLIELIPEKEITE